MRHGEAVKNVLDQHGGEGSCLTLEGRRQMAARALEVRGVVGRRACRLVAHNVPQVAEGASILATQLDVHYVLDDRLRGLDLGQLAGLSRANAAAAFPAAASRLEKWRAGELALNELELPGGEPVDAFRARISAALGEALSSGAQAVVMVLTRSTLIMFRNLLSLESAFAYDRYRSYDFAPAALMQWRISDRLPTLSGD